MLITSSLSYDRKMIIDFDYKIDLLSIEITTPLLSYNDDNAPKGHKN